MRGGGAQDRRIEPKWICNIGLAGCQNKSFLCLAAIEASPNAVRFSLAAKVGWSDMVHGAGVALRQLCPVAYPCLAGSKLDAATVLGGSDGGAPVYLFRCPARTSTS